MAALAVFRPRVDALLGALASVPRVVWLTIHQARPYYAGANDVIRGSVAAHPNVSVGDWNAVIRPGDTGDDGLHLTPEGGTHMATFIAGLAEKEVAATTTHDHDHATTTTTSTVAPTTTLAPATPPSTTVDADEKNRQALAAEYQHASPPGSTGGGGATPWLVALACLVAGGAGVLGWLRARAARGRARGAPGT